MRALLIFILLYLFSSSFALTFFNDGIYASTLQLTPTTNCLVVLNGLHVNVYNGNFAIIHTFNIPTPPAGYNYLSVNGVGVDFDTDAHLEVMYYFAVNNVYSTYVWDTVSGIVENNFTGTGYTSYLGNERIVTIVNYGTSYHYDVYRSGVQVGNNDEFPSPSSSSMQGFPNPFLPNCQTYRVDFELQTADHVNLSVYNIKGQKVRALVSNVSYSAGKQNVSWDGKDEVGQLVAPGFYLVELQTATTNKVIKTIVLN
jgi:hypothetical protein